MDTLSIAIHMIIIGIGLGLTFSPISASVINSAYEHERGVASALVIVLRLVGGTISVSTLTAIALWRVNVLAEQGGISTVLDYSTIEAYAQITGQVLAELGLIGAITCALALIPASLMRDKVDIVEVEESADKVPGD
ncbi:MAG: hypothetical protein U0694_27090 [Anaerolineae bacterium]